MPYFDGKWIDKSDWDNRPGYKEALHGAMDELSADAKKWTYEKLQLEYEMAVGRKLEVTDHDSANEAFMDVIKAEIKYREDHNET